MTKRQQKKIEREELTKTQVLNLLELEKVAKYERQTSKKPALILGILGVLFLISGFVYNPLVAAIKEVLKDEVSDVKLSNRLKSQPVCLVSDEFLSIDMEKALKAMNQDVKANKILEINPDHDLFKALSKEYSENSNIEDYANLLYDQALLIAGLNIKDPVKYTERITNLMLKSMNNK